MVAPRGTVAAAMPTVVQVISIDYGKGGRGGGGARRRAQLPTAWPVSDHDGDALHTVAMAEWTAYVPRTTVRALPASCARPEGFLVAGGVRVTVEDRAVVATVEATGARIVVERGWGQLRTNLRVTTFDASWYRDVVVNLARGDGPVTANLFAGTPSISRDLRRPIERRRKRRPD
jgi:hypothetical protein